MNRWLVGRVCHPSAVRATAETGGKPVPRFRVSKRELVLEILTPALSSFEEEREKESHA
jgi:hypothetical protein